MKSHTRGRAKRMALSVRSAHRIVTLFTLMFMFASMLAPIASQTAFAQDATPPVSGDQAIVVQPAEQPVAPVSEEPAAPVVEEPVAPVVEEPAAPVVEEPAAPVVEEPAAPVVDQPAAPVVEEPVEPVVDEPAAPVVVEPAAPAADAPADETSSVDVAVDTVEEVVPDPSAATCAASNATAPNIASDLGDYAPGSTVTLTGSGWVPGQTVEIFVDDDGVADAEMGGWSLFQTVDADQYGDIYFQFAIPNWFVADYFVTATGECTNATTTFTDGNVTVNSNTNGASGVSFTYAVSAGVKGCPVTTPGSSTSFGTNIQVSTNSSSLVLYASAAPAGWIFSGWNAGTGSGGSSLTTCVDIPNGQTGTTVTATYTKVAKQNQTVNFTSTAPTNATVGSTYTPAATTNGNGTLSYLASGACSIDNSVVTMTTVGNCTVTANASETATHNVGSSSQTFSVGKGTVTLAVTDLAYTYDGNAKAATVTPSVSGLTGLTVTYHLNGAGAPVAPINAGTYQVQVTLNNANYNLSYVPVNLVINKASQSVSFTSPAPSAAKVGSTYTPVVNASGTVTLTASGGACTIASGEVTMNSVGTCTLTASADATGNYLAGSNTQTFSIGKGTVTLTLGNLDHEYNGEAKSATVTNLPTGETAVTIRYTDTNGDPVVAVTEAGKYNVYATLNGTNYTGSGSAVLVIGQGTATITLADLGHTYDGTAKEATATSDAIGSPVVKLEYFQGSTKVASPTAAGSYDVVATLTDLDNYKDAKETGTLVIGQGTATITLADLGHTYDGTAKEATATSDAIGSPVVKLEYFQGSTKVASPTAAGSYDVVATLTDLDNYKDAKETGTLVIGQGTATITLADLGHTYDGTAKEATATSDAIGSPVVKLEYFQGSTKVASPTAAGSYDVVATLTDLDNYKDAKETGTLVIGKLTASVNPNPMSKTEGAADPVLTGTLSGFLPGDKVTAMYTRQAGTVPGTYDITATLTAAQGVLDNYNVTYNKGLFTIEAKKVCVTEIQSPFKLGTKNVVKYGSVIPVKVRLTDCVTGAPVTDAAPTIQVFMLSNGTPSGTAEVISSSSSADTGNQLRHTGDGYYVFNLSTKSASFKDSTASYQIVVTVGVDKKTGEIGIKP